MNFEPALAHVVVNNIRSLMAYTGASAMELANQSGIPETDIHRIVVGKLEPSLEHLEKFAIFFGIEAWQLMLPTVPSRPEELADIVLENLSRCDHLTVRRARLIAD